MAAGWVLGAVIGLASGAGSELRTPDDTATSIARQRAGLRHLLISLDAQPELVPATTLPEPRLLDPEPRAQLLSLWAAFADRILALEVLASAHSRFWEQDGAARRQDLTLHRSAFLASYRFAMDFIERIERNPGLPRLLNESNPEFGVDENAYARLKYRYLHVGRASEFAALEALYRVDRKHSGGAGHDLAAEDAKRIWKRGTGSGPRMTAANALRIVQRTGHSLWLPLQERFARWMGDVRVRRSGEALIAPAQIEALSAKLEPGDVLLQRREWYLTNAGIPGFWTHAALYVGTPAERAAFFGDPGLEAALRAANPAAYAAALHADGVHPPRVLEAIAEGVVFTTLERSAAADSIVVLRPRLPRDERAAALQRAFYYAGRPYDYDFDFLTDGALVCSELIYKAYQPTRQARGLSLPVQTVAGRPMLTPNEIARLYARESRRSSAQLEFVAMLDGDEATRRAHWADAPTFVQSWQRPKWHIVTSRLGEPASVD